ncbi:cytochrome P450 [Gordonia sp. HY285]|uniref:cytochrome P450 n=1 Tax=Gordonia liuliyuniae TaxID=2911517 RepID=UPI001F2F098E|nr:cytochrome P450 [Gordonia liuliyuniae]MCF8610253.1 cytochrome P450 [Gordonia liuliyuniae]
MTTEVPQQSSTSALPPKVPLPTWLQGVGFLAARRGVLRACRARYGPVFELEVPVFGNLVVISDPAMAKQLFTSGAKTINVQPNLGRVLGSGSIFAIEGTDHRRRRKLLTPPLHGKRIRTYEQIVEEETEREIATWPTGKRFASLEPMMRITLNVILRAVFGADGDDFDDLRAQLPDLVAAGSRSATMPDLPRALSRVDPNVHLRLCRARYQETILRVIGEARSDPHLADRDDILALMLQSTYDDGSVMTDDEIADELLTLLAAGHETTATTLAWLFERIQRHRPILDDLAVEAQGDGDELRHAVILETQRSRPVIDFAGRHVVADDLEVGPWRIPRGHNAMVAISLLHDDSDQFRDPERFDPYRFVGSTPSAAWLPFGGGTRRCIGAAFATMEMDVVVRTVLREFRIEPSTARAEGLHSRGVAFAPRFGGRMAVRRR